MARILPETDLQKALQDLPGWTLEQGQLSRTIKFKDFPDAIAFVDRIVDPAEEADHHPDIDIRWNTVTLRLFTHSQKALTDKDIALARKISLLCS
jgi:4a-hydroxytetrahydrobiopterin dehydratase